MLANKHINSVYKSQNADRKDSECIHRAVGMLFRGKTSIFSSSIVRISAIACELFSPCFKIRLKQPQMRKDGEGSKSNVSRKPTNGLARTKSCSNLGSEILGFLIPVWRSGNAAMTPLNVSAVFTSNARRKSFASSISDWNLPLAVFHVSLLSLCTLSTELCWKSVLHPN